MTRPLPAQSGDTQIDTALRCLYRPADTASLPQPLAQSLADLVAALDGTADAPRAPKADPRTGPTTGPTTGPGPVALADTRRSPTAAATHSRRFWPRLRALLTRPAPRP